jgi:hypothetical protein
MRHAVQNNATFDASCCLQTSRAVMCPTCVERLSILSCIRLEPEMDAAENCRDTRSLFRATEVCHLSEPVARPVGEEGVLSTRTASGVGAGFQSATEEGDAFAHAEQPVAAVRVQRRRTGAGVANLDGECLGSVVECDGGGDAADGLRVLISTSWTIRYAEMSSPVGSSTVRPCTRSVTGSPARATRVKRESSCARPGCGVRRLAAPSSRIPRRYRRLVTELHGNSGWFGSSGGTDATTERISSTASPRAVSFPARCCASSASPRLGWY